MSEMQGWFNGLVRIGLAEGNCTDKKFKIKGQNIGGHHDHDHSNFQREFAGRALEAFIEGPKTTFVDKEKT